MLFEKYGSLIKNKMTKQHQIFGIIVFILTICFGCKKEVPDIISVDFKVVDEFGHQRSKFSTGDSIIFEFYLSNFSGEMATYLRPCAEFINYLKLYRKDLSGNYILYGQPEYYCVAIADYRNIENEETVLIGRMPWTWLAEQGWPEKEVGSYYVGDTLSLVINNASQNYIERAYLEIE